MAYNKTVWTDNVIPLSAANMNKIETGVYALDLQKIDSYLAFCGSVNVNMLDAAFGKINEGNIGNLGKQLAMYAWFKGKNKATYPYTSMVLQDTLQNILASLPSKIEISNSTELWLLIYASVYARGIVCDITDLAATATSEAQTINQNITITQANINAGKIYVESQMTRSQGGIGGTVSLNGVVVLTLSGEPKVTAIINLSACNITVSGVYTISKYFTYGNTYPTTLYGYIQALK